MSIPGTELYHNECPCGNHWQGLHDETLCPECGWAAEDFADPNDRHATGNAAQVIGHGYMHLDSARQMAARMTPGELVAAVMYAAEQTHDAMGLTLCKLLGVPDPLSLRAAARMKREFSANRHAEDGRVGFRVYEPTDAELAGAPA